MSSSPQPISLGTRSNRSRHGHEGDPRLINCYVEEVGREGKSPTAVYAIDGLVSWADLPDNGVRAMLALETELITVADRSIIQADTSGVGTVIGGLIGDGIVTMARNRATTTQVGACADGIFKIIQGGAVQDVTDPDLPPCNSVSHLNGYFLLTTPDGRIFSTALNDGTSIDGLDFASADANPDGLVRGFTRNQEFIAFGSLSTQFYQDVGGENFPLGLITSTQVGCLAAGSVADLDETVAFVAHDGTVRRLDGYQSVVISTHEVERLIDETADPSSITAVSWQRRGHTFYCLSGPDWTHVYDAKSGQWHERRSYGSSRWRCSAYAKFNGKHLFGDVSKAKIYRQDPDAYSEDGDPIVMVVQTPTVHGYPYRMRFNALYIDAIPGAGLNSPDPHNEDPKMMLDYSEDGGHTWSAQRQVSIGQIGKTKKRVVVRRLGASKEDGRIFRMSVSADVVKGISGLAIDADQLKP